MIRMLTLFALCFFGSVSHAAIVQARTTLLTSLDKNEVWPDSLALSDGLVWVGHMNTSEQSRNRVQVFDSKTLKLVAETPMPHSPIYLYPFTDTSVLIMGRTQPPWRTHFSIASLQGWQKGSQVALKTTTFPEEIQADRFTGTAQSLFFTEPGEASVFQWLNGAVHMLPPVLSGPGEMALLGDTLYVVERRSFDFGDETLTKISLATGKAEHTFAAPRNGLRSLLAIPEKNWVAVSEMMANQILLVQESNNQMVGTLSTPGFPRGITLLHHCLVTVAESKRVYFHHLDRAGFPLVAEWDLSGAGPSFDVASSAVADPSTGRLFVRGVNPCASCPQTRSSVISAEDPQGTTAAACNSH